MLKTGIVSIHNQQRSPKQLRHRSESIRVSPSQQPQQRWRTERLIMCSSLDGTDTDITDNKKSNHIINSNNII